MPDDRWRIAPLVLEGTLGRATINGDLGWPGRTDMAIDLDGVKSGDWLAAASVRLRQQFAQVKVELTELAAVVAGRDGDHSLAGCRANAA
mgnify:CR=1 FL=1